MATTLLDWILHLDVHLQALTAQHGTWVYLLLFAVILVETGLVIMPFLPGDSLLFVAGALAAGGVFSLPLLVALLTVAAIVGDALNFAVGSYFRRRAIDSERIPLLKAEHLKRTQDFFLRHGRKTIILARFVPVVRTLAPFVAALGAMPYRVFIMFNVIGGFLWVAVLLGAGYLFGNVSWIRNNLTFVLLGIVLVSMLPGVVGWLNERRAGARASAGTDTD